MQRHFDESWNQNKEVREVRQFVIKLDRKNGIFKR